MDNTTRRLFIRNSALGIFGLSATQAFGGTHLSSGQSSLVEDPLFYRFPALADTLVAEVVGAAHGRFDTVKELVSKQPELARACWDWGFGDFESALGAASHMGRRDIAEFLMEHGARPDLFTYAMLGDLKALQAMIEAVPGIQKIAGPHGITLLQHAKNRLRRKDVSSEDIKKVNEVIAYLEELGDADLVAESLEMAEKEGEFYSGDFRFGPNEDEILEVTLNRRKMLSLGRKGTFGRPLRKTGDHLFGAYGSPSVKISFEVTVGHVASLTIHEPMPLIKATKI